MVGKLVSNRTLKNGGKAQHSRARGSMTLADAIQIYKRERRGLHSAGTKLKYDRIIKCLGDNFGQIPLGEFGESFMAEALQYLQNANKTNLGNIRSIFSSLGHIKGVMLGCERPTLPRELQSIKSVARTRVLEGEELERFLEVVLAYRPLEFRDAFLTMLLTGMRFGTVQRMHGENMSLSGRVYTIPREHMKFRKKNCVCVFSNELWEFLEYRIIRAVENNEHFFKYSNNIRATEPFIKQSVVFYHWQKMIKGKFYDLRMHDLRRTYASQLALNSVPISQICGMLHHDSVNTTSIYTKNTTSQMREVAEVVNWGLKKHDKVEASILDETTTAFDKIKTTVATSLCGFSIFFKRTKEQ